jgi:hypothetical protein
MFRLAWLKAQSDVKLKKRLDNRMTASKRRTRNADDVESYRSISTLGTYELPLAKRVRSKPITESNDPQHRRLDQLAEAAEDAEFPETELLAYIRHLADAKLTRKEEVRRGPSSTEMDENGSEYYDSKGRSVLRERFAPCALVALGVVLEEIVGETMRTWASKDKAIHDTIKKRLRESLRSSTVRDEFTGPLQFSEHALAVEIELQLEGSDVNFVNDCTDVQSRLEALFGRDLSAYSNQIRARVEAHKRLAARNSAYDTTTNIPEFTTMYAHSHPLQPAAEPKIGYDVRECGPAVEGWYTSQVQSCRHTGLVARRAQKLYEMQAVKNNKQSMPRHIQEAICLDRYNNKYKKKDPQTLRVFANRVFGADDDTSADDVPLHRVTAAPVGFDFESDDDDISDAASVADDDIDDFVFEDEDDVTMAVD